ncbi:RNA polymerase sigma factor SigJ [Brevibacillus sp. B_LB10_24]|uniref:RNA polymerase sigma factor SigJ n=1 Tax=Brevibacillus sp. B_LB10_24 TaxID=3380645 RepID=UPI0038B85D5A
MERGKLYSDLKPLLLSLAYHTLGSITDAEDIVHEVFLSWEEKPPQQVRDVKSYLCRSVHNRCVDFIRSSSRNREAYAGPWLPEPVDTGELQKNDPLAEMVWKESLSTAGLLLLQQLSATERIVFLLREVFHYRFDEIAEIVDKSTANCRQIFHRAKKGIGQLPDRSPEVMEKKTALAERFAEALMTGNIGLLIELLSSDTVLYMDGGGKVKAALRPITGSDRIIRYFLGIAHEIPAGSRYETCEINGMPGIRLVFGEMIFAVITFQYLQDQVSNLYVVMNPEKLSHFNRMK